MVQQKKLPTNTDLASKIDRATSELKKELNDMNIILLRHDKAIGLLEDKSKLEEYGRKLIDNYKAEEEKKRRDHLTDDELKNRNNAWIKLGILLGVLIAIAIAYAAGKGIRT
jgi:hypothetical protein